jgi:adenine-specific DNA-methyltransferase
MRNYDAQKSEFCSKVKVKKAFDHLIQHLNAKVIILSYNDEGLLSHEDLVQILENKGRVTVKKQLYKKFKAQKGVERKTVYEYVFIVEV